ncbi:MAG: hypothetical protein QW134_06730 [Nitrososphaeria archaeon]
MNKGAVDELRSRKRKEHWCDTVSFQKTKKNYVGNLYTMISIVLLLVIFASPIISIFNKSLISTEISLLELWAGLFVFLLVFYMPLALLA